MRKTETASAVRAGNAGVTVVGRSAQHGMAPAVLLGGRFYTTGKRYAYADFGGGRISGEKMLTTALREFAEELFAQEEEEAIASANAVGPTVEDYLVCGRPFVHNGYAMFVVPAEAIVAAFGLPAANEGFSAIDVLVCSAQRNAELTSVALVGVDELLRGASKDGWVSPLTVKNLDQGQRPADRIELRGLMVGGDGSVKTVGGALLSFARETSAQPRRGPAAASAGAKAKLPETVAAQPTPRRWGRAAGSNAARAEGAQAKIRAEDPLRPSAHGAHPQYIVAEVLSASRTKRRKQGPLLCELRTGASTVFAVTRYENVEAGMLIILAPEGSEVNGKEVEKAKARVAGAWTSAIICGPVEMCWPGDASQAIVLSASYTAGDSAPAAPGAGEGDADMPEDGAPEPHPPEKARPKQAAPAPAAPEPAEQGPEEASGAERGARQGSRQARRREPSGREGKGAAGDAYVFDMETGDPDDVLTLLLLCAHPGVDLRAVTITPGTCEQVALVRWILQRVGLAHVRLGAQRWPEGAGKELRCLGGSFYGSFGRAHAGPPECERADEVLLECCGGDVTLLTGGPLHNLGDVLRLPGFHLGRWVAQGGFAGEGVVPEQQQLDKFRGLRVCSTWNFCGNIPAARAALASTAIGKKVCVSKNVCHATVYDYDWHRALEAAAAAEAHVDANSRRESALRMMHRVMDGYLRQKPGGKKLHDPLALAVALDEDVCELAEVRLFCEKGRWGSYLSSGSNTWISVAHDAEKFRQTLLGRTMKPQKSEGRSGGEGKQTRGQAEHGSGEEVQGSRRVGMGSMRQQPSDLEGGNLAR
ncbi:unnamed protein product [Prorocentrum cordatum]|uniref:Inosine/uridine-preferring nucleoside hydrolase domain-containing protein n=1 Tax=Prorocentrum cordatum TaxID=2364126 RepID=A0ABN9WQ73_9DINO|nr:unnamed protein product [Polarella glacialis]